MYLSTYDCLRVLDLVEAGNFYFAKTIGAFLTLVVYEAVGAGVSILIEPGDST